MGRKTLALGLTCLLLIILPCCKKTPTSPDIEEVLNPVINSFTVSPSSINLGESSTLSWSTENATTVTINQEVVSTSGERNVSPEETTTYILTAKNNNGEVTESLTLEVNAPEIPDPLPVIKYFLAPSMPIEPGNPALLLWSVMNSTRVGIDYPGSRINDPVSIIDIGEEGVYAVYPRETAQYKLIAQNDYTIENGTPVLQTVTVRVIAYPGLSLTYVHYGYESISGVWRGVIHGEVTNTGNVPVYKAWIRFDTTFHEHGYPDRIHNGYASSELKNGGRIEAGQTVSFRAEHEPLILSWDYVLTKEYKIYYQY